MASSLSEAKEGLYGFAFAGMTTPIFFARARQSFSERRSDLAMSQAGVPDRDIAVSIMSWTSVHAGDGFTVFFGAGFGAFFTTGFTGFRTACLAAPPAFRLSSAWRLSASRCLARISPRCVW